jgi:hypothetical protein
LNIQVKSMNYISINEFQDKLLDRLVSFPREYLVKFGKALFIPNADSMDKALIAKKIAYNDVFKEVRNEDHFYWVDGMDFTFRTHGTFFPHQKFFITMKVPEFRNRDGLESFTRKVLAGIQARGLLKKLRFHTFDAYGTRANESEQECAVEYYFAGDDGFDNILYVTVDHVKGNVVIYPHLFRLTMDTKPLKNVNPRDYYDDQDYGMASILQDTGDYIDFFYRLSICIRYYNKEIKKIDKTTLKEYLKR